MTTGPYDRASLEAAGADVVIEDLNAFAQLREVFA